MLEQFCTFGNRRIFFHNKIFFGLCFVTICYSFVSIFLV